MTLRRDVRRAVDEDIPGIVEVFWQGVHVGAAPIYDAAQRAAWLPVAPAPHAFAARLAGQTVRVAVEGGRIAGFMTLRADGYLDFAYVRPEARGTGTADALHAAILNAAAVAGLTELTARASDLARPFLARRGWHVVAPAPQTRDGTIIPATDMARHLVA